MRLPRRSEVRFHPEMDLQRAALEPTTSARRQVRRLGHLGDAQEIRVEPGRLRFTARGHRQLHVFDPLDRHADSMPNRVRRKVRGGLAGAAQLVSVAPTRAARSFVRADHHRATSVARVRARHPTERSRADDRNRLDGHRRLASGRARRSSARQCAVPCLLAERLGSDPFAPQRPEQPGGKEPESAEEHQREHQSVHATSSDSCCTTLSPEPANRLRGSARRIGPRGQPERSRAAASFVRGCACSVCRAWRRTPTRALVADARWLRTDPDLSRPAADGAAPLGRP